MDTVHLHLLLNHIPVIGTIFSVPLFAYAVLRKSNELKELALMILVFAALVAIPVYLTGEPAEEAVEKLAGVSTAALELHEDGAKVSMILMAITGVISLLGLVLVKTKKTLAGWFVFLALVSSTMTAVSMARTANLGGQIRHSEIRTGDPGRAETVSPAEKPGKKKVDDDD